MVQFASCSNWIAGWQVLAPTKGGFRWVTPVRLRERDGLLPPMLVRQQMVEINVLARRGAAVQGMAWQAGLSCDTVCRYLRDERPGRCRRCIVSGQARASSKGFVPGCGVTVWLRRMPAGSAWQKHAFIDPACRERMHACAGFSVSPRPWRHFQPRRLHHAQSLRPSLPAFPAFPG